MRPPVQQRARRGRRSRAAQERDVQTPKAAPTPEAFAMPELLALCGWRVNPLPATQTRADEPTAVRQWRLAFAMSKPEVQHVRRGDP